MGSKETRRRCRRRARAGVRARGEARADARAEMSGGREWRSGTRRTFRRKEDPCGAPPGRAGRPARARVDNWYARVMRCDASISAVPTLTTSQMYVLLCVRGVYSISPRTRTIMRIAAATREYRQAARGARVAYLRWASPLASATRRAQSACQCLFQQPRSVMRAPPSRRSGIEPARVAARRAPYPDRAVSLHVCGVHSSGSMRTRALGRVPKARHRATCTLWRPSRCVSSCVHATAY